MTDTSTVRRAITERLTRVQDLGNDILRGERTYQGKTFATAYIDLSDRVVERADNLTKFQEGLLGSEFFKGDGAQRWNSYLYFWAGPNSQNHAEFATAKARIEGDRHFARKFVLNEEDFWSHLGDVVAHSPSKQAAVDPSVQWEELLRTASLSMLLEKRPRTKLLELISSGEAFVPEIPPIVRTAFDPLNEPLSTGRLILLRVGKFRSAISNRNFQLGNVNLIFGQNGTGKTSLLESIEALYCGHIRRDPEATVESIEAEILTPSGASITVKSKTAAATIKARNRAWYGRSNQQSSAISQAFTRFNFLDTDAAFRLSSDATPDQIKRDLSQLLVGAETSALWTDLSKLRDETIAKRTSVNERMPTILRQTELLGNEVRRLQESPTESTTLAKSFHANLRALGCTWPLGDDTASVLPSHRSRLESLSRGFRQAIAVSQSTPTTTARLRQHAQQVSAALGMVGRLEEEYERIRQELTRNERLSKRSHSALLTLRTWVIYCEAGAPTLAASLLRARTVVSEARVALAGISPDEVREVPVEYATRGLREAIRAATENLSLAEEQVRSGVESLLQRERLGQSLAALRADLQNLARTLLDRTGDEMHCPVCGAAHLEGELLLRIESLTTADDPSLTDGLRQAVQVARERAQRERDVLVVLRSLQRFAERRDTATAPTTGELMEMFTSDHRALSDSVAELDRLELSKESLELFGVNWDGYADALSAASALLGVGANVEDLQLVTTHVASLQNDIEGANTAASEARERLTALKSDFDAASATAGLLSSAALSPTEIRVSLQRLAGRLDTVLAFLDDASQVVTLHDDKPIETFVLSLEEAMNSFDRAQHARHAEVAALTELSNKTNELHQAIEQFRLVTAREENLTKAIRVLSEIVERHSLEKATQDALDSIRGHVSDIFARIHSPAEYTLADFTGDQLLTTRDGLHAHGVSQVSTGQRAALALSIFLALNRSAETVPPVLLIDDPIAHIDDLNALSFLDYLRDLAVSTRKQIFFATADARLAALFERKFEFLGPKQFRKIVLSREP